MALNPDSANMYSGVSLLPKRRNLSGGRCQPPTLQLNGTIVAEDRRPLIYNPGHCSPTSPFWSPSPRGMNHLYESDLTEVVSALKSSPAVISLGDNKLRQAGAPWNSCSVCRAYMWCKVAVAAGMLALLLLLAACIVRHGGPKLNTPATEAMQKSGVIPRVEQKTEHLRGSAQPRREETRPADGTPVGYSWTLRPCGVRNPDCGMRMDNPPVIHGTIESILEEALVPFQGDQSAATQKKLQEVEVLTKHADPVYKLAVQHSRAPDSHLEVNSTSGLDSSGAEPQLDHRSGSSKQATFSRHLTEVTVPPVSGTHMVKKISSQKVVENAKSTKRKLEKHAKPRMKVKNAKQQGKSKARQKTPPMVPPNTYM